MRWKKRWLFFLLERHVQPACLVTGSIANRDIITLTAKTTTKKTLLDVLPDV